MDYSPTYHIYGLVDPNTFMVKYVGCSIDVKQRLIGHMSDKTNKRKLAWINSLRETNQKPGIVIFFKTKDILVAREREVVWQEQFNQDDLVNGVAGRKLYNNMTFVRKYEKEFSGRTYERFDYNKLNPAYLENIQ
jgi:hypothetical protein